MRVSGVSVRGLLARWRGRAWTWKMKMYDARLDVYRTIIGLDTGRRRAVSAGDIRWLVLQRLDCAGRALGAGRMEGGAGRSVGRTLIFYPRAHDARVQRGDVDRGVERIGGWGAWHERGRGCSPRELERSDLVPRTTRSTRLGLGYTYVSAS